MKFLKHYAICVLIISLTLSGCLGVAGEPFHPTLKRLQQEHQEQHKLEAILAGYGDVEACMFTIWYFTKPDAPAIGDTADKCKVIVTSMDEWAFENVMEEIEKELEKVEEEVEPVICVGNCI